jgi:hypothetical protein
MSARLEQADRLQRSDPLEAYRIYDEVLTESTNHILKDEQFVKRLASAEQSRTDLYQKVQDKIRVQEAERHRLAEEEARKKAAEQQSIAKEQERKLAADEAQRVRESKRRADEYRRKQAAALYRNVPNSARNALNAVKKVEARIEIGVSFGDYASVVGDAWFEVKIFIESPDGKKVPEFSMLLTKAVSDYKLALEIWQNKIKHSTLYGGVDVEMLQQTCWAQAGEWITLAESLLEDESVQIALESIADIPKFEKDLDAEWRKIEDKILHRGR